VASPEPPSVARGLIAAVGDPPSAVPSGDAVRSTALRAASIGARFCVGDCACRTVTEKPHEGSRDRAAGREARERDDRRRVFGIGLAFAVLIDATIVRVVLVPAAMVLVGDANWWLPSWLDRILPRMQLEVADQPEIVEEVAAPSLATER
jgi:hypothetical protein